MVYSRQPDPARRERWGYSFKLTDDHLSDDEVDSLRAHYDELGSATLEKLQAIVACEKAETGHSDPTTKTDMYMVLAKHHDEDETLSKFWKEAQTLPPWVDLAQIERGQKFFARYAMANCLGLAIQGFIRENSAAPGIAEVFARTGGLATKNLLTRVIETFAWLVQVTNSLESIIPGGEGHAATVRVRLLHASVRQRILKLAASRPGYFDVKGHGAPVNDLDSLHAISQFSCMPMWDSLPKMGIQPTEQEIIDFIALFRYIAYLTGTPEHYFATPRQAKAIMESLFLQKTQMNKTSKIMAHNFITWLVDAPPVYVSRAFLEAGSRLLNGHEPSDALGLGRPGTYSYCVFLGQNVIVASMARVQRMFPSFDEYIIKLMRRNLYAAVTDHAYLMGDKSFFDFKYIPQLDVRFDNAIESSKYQNTRNINSKRVLERIFFAAFVLAVLIGVLVIGCSWWVMGFALQKVDLSRLGAISVIGWYGLKNRMMV